VSPKWRTERFGLGMIFLYSFAHIIYMVPTVLYFLGVEPPAAIT
jgi:hypothetical protein